MPRELAAGRGPDGGLQQYMGPGLPLTLIGLGLVLYADPMKVGVRFLTHLPATSPGATSSSRLVGPARLPHSLTDRQLRRAHPEPAPIVTPVPAPPSRPSPSLLRSPTLAGVAAAFGVLIAGVGRAVWGVRHPPPRAIAMLQFGRMVRTKEEIEEDEFVDDEDETYMGYFPPSPDDTDEDNDEELNVPEVRDEYLGDEYRLPQYLPPSGLPSEAAGDAYRDLLAQWPPPGVVAFTRPTERPTSPSPAEIQRNVRTLQARLMDACQSARVQTLPTIVANSQGYGPSAIRAAYDAGQRAFAEGRLFELLRKCERLPGDVRWHYTGLLAKNDVRPLLQGCPGLAVVETVDSVELADLLNTLVLSMRRRRLKVYLPINFLKRVPYRAPPAKLLWALPKAEREREIQKAQASWYAESLRDGVAVGAELPVAQHIFQACPGLQLAGLMTNGVGGVCTTAHYHNLVLSRRRIAQALGLEDSALQLSMGTGVDLEAAVANGATGVRVAHELFGVKPVLPEL